MSLDTGESGTGGMDAGDQEKMENMPSSSGLVVWTLSASVLRMLVLCAASCRNSRVWPGHHLCTYPFLCLPRLPVYIVVSCRQVDHQCQARMYRRLLPPKPSLISYPVLFPSNLVSRVEGPRPCVSTDCPPFLSISPYHLGR